MCIPRNSVLLTTSSLSLSMVTCLLFLLPICHCCCKAIELWLVFKNTKLLPEVLCVLLLNVTATKSIVIYVCRFSCIWIMCLIMRCSWSAGPWRSLCRRKRSEKGDSQDYLQFAPPGTWCCWLLSWLCHWWVVVNEKKCSLAVSKAFSFGLNRLKIVHLVFY